MKRATSTPAVSAPQSLMANGLSQLSEGFPESSSTVNWNAIILIDGIALARDYAAPGETCRIPGLGDVSVDWVRSILPDALVDVVVHNGVDITTYASATRYTPRAIKVAVNVRDGFSCVVRGCHRNRRVERDHRDEFAATHDTSYANLGLLCDRHHDEKTHRGARLERHRNEWWWYPPPTPASTNAPHDPTAPIEPWRSPVGETLTRWNLDQRPHAA